MDGKECLKVEGLKVGSWEMKNEHPSPSIEWERVRKWLMRKGLRISMVCKECGTD
jgi:hypothetical protein